jgi:hypothetical protein
MGESDRSKQSQVISHILEHPSRIDSLVRLQKIDAQVVVDFLAEVSTSYLEQIIV